MGALRPLLAGLGLALLGLVGCRTTERARTRCLEPSSPERVEACRVACDARVLGEGGCLTLGMLIEKSDVAGAQQAFGRGCDGGRREGCERALALVRKDLQAQATLRGTQVLSLTLPEVKPEALARRDAIADRLCQLGDCGPRYLFALGDGTDAAQRAWQAMCGGDRQRQLSPEQAPRIEGRTGHVDLEPPPFAGLISQCAFLADLGVWVGEQRDRCLRGGDLRSCTNWSEALLEVDTPRALAIGLPEEHRRRRLENISSLSAFRMDRYLDHLGAGRRLWSYADSFRGRKARRPAGGCAPGFGGCGKSDEARRLARARVEAGEVAAGMPDRLGEAEIRSAVGVQNAALLECYRAALIDSPRLSGHVKVAARIDGTGQLWAVVYQGADLPDAELVSCALEALSDLRLRPEAAGATFTLRIDLSPEAR